MARKLFNISLSILISIALLLVYTIIHEGAHALFAIIFGGKITAFDFNMLSGYPHVGYQGNMEPYQSALISLAGPLIPFLFFIAGLLFMNKKRHLFGQKIFCIMSAAVLGSLIPNVIIPVLLASGAEVMDQDIARFIINLNLNCYLVSLATALLFTGGAILAARRLRFKEALAYQVNVNISTKSN